MIEYSSNSSLDDLDKAILQILQTDGRISNADLGRRINLSPPAIHARIKRLEKRGCIHRYVALLDREVVGYDMLCFVNISLRLHQLEHVENFRKAVQHMPKVLECHHVTGEYDYLLKVVIHNRKDLEHFLLHQITPIPGVAHIHTSLVLTEVKSTTALPLE